MSIFNKVTLEILKKNKTRTIVTIVGIILSAAMFTAVTTTISSLQNYMYENAVYENGDWHVSATEADESFFDFLRDPASMAENPNQTERFEEGKVESYVYSQQLGYALAEGCTNEYKPYLYIIGADKNFCNTMPVHLTSGRLPEKSDEIILPEHLAENGEVYYKLGDALTLEIGNRVSEGYVLGQNNPYEVSEDEDGEIYPTEVLEVTETRTYTVVGFYERPTFENYSAPGYTAITTTDKVRPEGSLYNFYFKMEDPQDALEWYSSLDGASVNTEVLASMGITAFNGLNAVLTGLATIICGLIMFGSVSLIYNAFSISISERTKQFGLLSSIGATKRQIRLMVLFEALFVSVIGIPLGILAGVGGMGVTFHFIGKAFSTLTDYAIPLTLNVYPWAIVAACLITLVTVLISAWIPSKRATMVTAVEAIRQSDDVKQSRRENDKFAYRIFGLPGMIASKYYKRSKKKYRATVVSLFMSIVLFVSASALTNYLTDSVERGFAGSGYDIIYHYNPTDYMTEEEVTDEAYENMISHEQLSKLFEDAKKVTSATYAAAHTEHVIIDTKYLSDEYLAYWEEKYASLNLDYKVEERAVFVAAVFVADEEYEAFLEQNGLEKDLYANPQKPIGVAIDGSTFFDYDLEKYVTTNILKSENCEITFGNDTESATVQVGAVIKERPYFVSDLYELAIVYPYSLKAQVLQELNDQSYSCDHYILSDDHKVSFEDMKEIIVGNGLGKQNLYDYAEGVDESRTLIMIINVFAYGFIILISLIAAANVFNTVSTNIALRRKELAMLTSVGMSHKEMSRMMNFECILYGSRALLFGLPVSALITWFIYLAISEGFSVGYYLPWTAIIIATLSVFIVVFATMLYSMRKIKADNPIDALKNENI